MRAPGLVLVAVLALTGCGSPSTPAATAPTPSGPAVLAAGKGGVPLQGSYLSPDGFVPALSLAVPAGWTSTHRGDDAFDLSKPESGVVVALITPMDDVVATALARLRAHAKGTVRAVAGKLDGHPATGFEEVGGSGELIASPSGTLSLDATPKGRLMVLGTDVEDVPLLAVVLVPDASQWAAQKTAADQLLAGLTPG